MATLNIIRGITHPPLELIFTDSSGVQVDIQTWGVESQARKAPHKTVILDLGPVILPVGVLLGYPGEVDGPGRVKLADFSSTQTLAMTDVKLEWDVVLITPDGRRLPFLVGSAGSISTIITEPS